MFYTRCISSPIPSSADVWVVREPEQAPPLTESMPDHAGTEATVALLILERATRDGQWGLAGGTVEAGETYEEAAVREVAEETAIDCTVEDCRFARRVVLSAEDADDPPVHLRYVLFVGRYEDGSITIEPGELRGAAWFDRPPARKTPGAERFAASFWEE